MKLRHYLIIVSLLVSAVFSLPHLHGLWRYKEFYSPLVSIPKLQHIRDETYTYAAQVNHLLNGYLFGDPYIYEYRLTSAPFISELASIIPVAFLALISFSVGNAFILSDIIFPALLFLFIAHYLIKTGYKISFSIAAALGVIVTPYLSALFPFVWAGDTDITGPTDATIFYSRTPHPQVSSIYLFMALFATVYLLGPAKPKNYFINAVILGLSLYSSPYIALTVVLASILLLPVIVRKSKVKLLLMMAGVLTVMALPIIVNVFINHGVYTNSEFISRFSFAKSFLFPQQLRYLIYALVLVILEKRSRLSIVIVFYIIAASILIDAHQLVFARNIQGDHFVSRIIAPLSTLSLFIIGGRIINKFNQLFSNGIWIAAAAVIILTGTVRQIGWLRVHSTELNFSREKRDILDEIKLRTKKDDVIGTTSVSLNDEVRALTGRYVYYAPGDRSIISEAEQIDRICTLFIMEGKQSMEGLFDYILGTQSSDHAKVALYRGKFNDCYNKGVRSHKYKLDYVVINEEDGAGWKLEGVRL